MGQVIGEASLRICTNTAFGLHPSAAPRRVGWEVLDDQDTAPVMSFYHGEGPPRFPRCFFGVQACSCPEVVEGFNYMRAGARLGGAGDLQTQH